MNNRIQPVAASVPKRRTALQWITPTLLGLTLAACSGPGTKDAPVSSPQAIKATLSILDQDPATLEGQDAILRKYYATKVSLPPAIFEAFESGRMDRETLDATIAKGTFPNFFRLASIEDLPADLRWEDGLDLPDIGSPDAVKGGVLYGRLQDFPRTFRTVGPDSNGSFRTLLLDDVAMSFAHRHPSKTEITDTGFRHFPGLAKSWAVVPEERTVYVRINPAARWSDGQPITVDDVFFMFYFFQSPFIQAPWYNNWYDRSYTQVTRFDDLTFSIQVPEAKPDFVSRVLGLRPIPAHFYTEFGEDFPSRYQWEQEPTTSPYLILPENVRRGSSIRLVRNPDWWARDQKFWRNRFNFDALQLTVIRETSKAFEAFRKGELDSFGMNLAEYNYDRLPDSDPLVQNGFIGKYTFYNDVPRPTYGLYINQARPLLSNLDIRVGLQHAFNWQLVIDQYFRGDYFRMRTTSDGYGPFTHPDLQPRVFDVEKALAAFKRAGFTTRNPAGILTNASGERLAFTVTTGMESLQDVLTILQQEALKAGVELRVEVLDATAAWKKIQEKNHDIAFSAFGVSPEMYPRYWEMFHSVNAFDQAFLDDQSVNPQRSPRTQTNNLLSLADPVIDQLIERYRSSEDVNEMLEISRELEERLHENAGFSPGFVMPFYRFASWRWIKWPDDINVKLSTGPGEWFLHWTIPEERQATLRGLRTGATFPPIIQINDQFQN
ncbi:MAG: extracellular solute-binding protein [Puniceicoccaceae bacterium]